MKKDSFGFSFDSGDGRGSFTGNFECDGYWDYNIKEVFFDNDDDEYDYYLATREYYFDKSEGIGYGNGEGHGYGYGGENGRGDGFGNGTTYCP